MIETIAIGAVVAVGKRLGDRWIDDIAAGIDGEFRRRLKRLAGGEEAEHAKNEAVQYVETHPGAAMQLLTAASPTGASEVPLIERFYAFLAFELAVVDGLGGLVALPGFLHGPQCIAVIDTRRTDYGGEMLLPDPSWEGLSTTERTPYIPFYDNDYSMIDFPQIWIVSLSDRARDAEVERLNELFFSADPPSPFDLHLEPPGGGISLHAIYERYVVLAGGDKLPISDPAGILLFRDALTKRVQLADERAERFKRAFE